MKIQKALTIVGLVAVASSMIAESALPRREVQKNKFGGIEIVDYYPTGLDKTVFMPQKKFLQDYERQTQYLEDALK
jgi:hypothetical protein